MVSDAENRLFPFVFLSARRRYGDVPIYLFLVRTEGISAPLPSSPIAFSAFLTASLSPIDLAWCILSTKSCLARSWSPDIYKCEATGDQRAINLKRGCEPLTSRIIAKLYNIIA